MTLVFSLYQGYIEKGSKNIYCLSGIGGTGTLRQNRLGPIPISSKKHVEKNFDRFVV